MVQFILTIVFFREAARHLILRIKLTKHLMVALLRHRLKSFGSANDAAHLLPKIASDVVEVLTIGCYPPSQQLSQFSLQNILYGDSSKQVIHIKNWDVEFAQALAHLKTRMSMLFNVVQEVDILAEQLGRVNMLQSNLM
jgi:hypothetical protein